MSWEERELVSLHDALGGERGHLTYTNHCHAGQLAQVWQVAGSGFPEVWTELEIVGAGGRIGWRWLPLALGARMSRGQDSLGRRNAASGTPVAAVPRGLGRWLCTNPFCPTFRIAGVPVLSAGPPEIRNLRPCSFLVFFFLQASQPNNRFHFPVNRSPRLLLCFFFLSPVQGHFTRLMAL